MYPATYNIKLSRGSTFYRKITVKNKNTGELTDFTGYTARMDIKSENSNTIILTLSTSNNGITLSNQGVIELKMSPIQSNSLTQDMVIYTLNLTSSSGDVFSYLNGIIEIL